MAQEPLSSDRIVIEALALLDEQGFDKVTLRAIAARLDVQAMSLYWHVPSKADLFDRMAAHLMRETLSGLDGATSWQEWYTQFGLAVWRSLHSVRDASRLRLAARPTFESLHARANETVDPLVGMGLPREDAVKLLAAVQSLVFGWVGFEQTMGSSLGQLLPIETTMAQSLAALLDGWAIRIAQSTSGAPPR